MAVLSERSRRELKSCHPDLQRLFRAVNEEMPIEVICGFRSMDAQNQAFSEGRSKLRWPKSRHNTSPSEAVDVVPLPINWNDLAAFRRLAKVVKATAEKLGIDVGRCSLRGDFPHWQLAPHEGMSY